LHAVKKLDGLVHLHVFGDGAERGESSRRSARFGIESYVTMHGRIARPQAALMQIGLLVLPSEAEGFGMVLIEAMAAGVPVVALARAGHHGSSLRITATVGSPAHQAK
jgi:glycosyltransferase involved in cell wall biosynthesis